MLKYIIGFTAGIIFLYLLFVLVPALMLAKFLFAIIVRYGPILLLFFALLAFVWWMWKKKR